MLKHLRRFFLIVGFLIILAALGFIGYFYFPFKPQSHAIDYENWNPGSVKHILSSFDHERLLMKISFEKDQEVTPKLRVGNRLIAGEKNDMHGRFWQFYVDNLNPASKYQLQILTGNSDLNTSPWYITTFPHPDSLTDNLKILSYTCAGGVEDKLFGKELFIPISTRQSLLKRALRFDPDIIIANGDHIYWDQKSFKISLLKKLASLKRDQKYGYLDLNKPMLSEANYDTFVRICNAQIADLYGCLLRKQSVYFITDDHDLLENDEALPDLVTLPPQDYQLDAARSTQLLYYPELFSPETFQYGMVSKEKGLSTSFGSLRFGTLVEIHLFDAKRYCTLDEEEAVLLPLDVEEWIKKRHRDSSIHWQIEVPSSPIAWTAGKWLEWYPDVLDVEGVLSNQEEKYMWQRGWWLQHQRILEALTEGHSTPIVIQGDLHMAAFGQIVKSGRLDMSQNPINVISGPPLGSGELAFPSSVRKAESAIPGDLEVRTLFPPVEKNGFTILDLTKEEITVDMFTWRSPENKDIIDQLKPTFSYVISKDK